MHRIALALVVALAATACGDDDATTTLLPATTQTTTAEAEFAVTSADGLVTVTVPAAALAGDPRITITRLEEAAYPATFAALVGTGAMVYALAPAGLTFDAPVTITMATPAGSDLSPTGVPLETLLITDGVAVEFLDDLTVIREGDWVTISGTTTHFSALSRVPNLISIEVRIAEVTKEFVSELGVDFTTRPGFAPAGFTAPTGLTPFGSGTGAGFTANGTDLIMRCDAPGSFTAEIGWEGIFGSGADGTAGLAAAAQTAPLPAGGVRLRLAVRPTVRCLGPGDVVLGLDLDYEDVVDHPGGELVVPGEDFLGGLSGLAGSLSGTDIPELALGLICDLDQDGVVDGTDWMYPPYPTTGDGMTRRFVLPIPGQAHYFIYGLRPDDFSALDTLERHGAPVLAQVPILGAVFHGSGRLESSVGLLGLPALPLVRRVFAAEDRMASKAELVVFITPRLLAPAE